MAEKARLIVKYTCFYFLRQLHPSLQLYLMQGWCFTMGEWAEPQLNDCTKLKSNSWNSIKGTNQIDTIHISLPLFSTSRPTNAPKLIYDRTDRSMNILIWVDIHERGRVPACWVSAVRLCFRIGLLNRFSIDDDFLVSLCVRAMLNELTDCVANGQHIIWNDSMVLFWMGVIYYQNSVFILINNFVWFDSYPDLVRMSEK